MITKFFIIKFSLVLILLITLTNTLNIFGQRVAYTATKKAVTISNPLISNFGSNFTSSAGSIYKNGEKINLFGASWFGLEDDGYSPHALWSRNLKEIILQVKNMGFTAFRVPFCPETLKNVPTGYISDTANPMLVGLKSLDLMDKFIEEINAQGMYILLDIHNYTCTNTLSPLWYTSEYSEQQLITDLNFVANRYRNLDNFIGIDIKNEPHDGQNLATSATWGIGNIATDWNLASERIGKSILNTNPNLLIFVEGIGDMQTTCSDEFGAWWGGNLMPVRCTPINPLSIPANKLVLSPHIYGPDVHYADEFKTTDFPNNLPAYWDKYFGFTQGLGNTLAIGEFGGKYGHNDQFSAANPKDVIWQNKIIDYFIEKKICNFFYWSLNPDSSDTGGIFQPNWLDPWNDKLVNLQRLMNSCKIIAVKTPVVAPAKEISIENWSIKKIRSRLWEYIAGKLIR